MFVKLWDGSRFEVKNRDEAVVIIKRELKGWMQKCDRLSWGWIDYHSKNMGEKPNIAYVVNEYGEYTDASAFIIDV